MCQFASEAAAAWVQAIGSVAAILIAIFYPRWQERAARVQALTTAERIADRVVVRFEQLVAELDSRASAAPGTVTTPELNLGELASVLDRLGLQSFREREITILFGLAGLCRRMVDVWNNEVKPKLAMPGSVDSPKIRDGLADARLFQIELGQSLQRAKRYRFGG